MEQKNKELLIKDLYSRVPYNTVVQIKNSGIWNLKGIEQDKIDEIGYEVIVWHGKNYSSSKTSFPISICKPYLFPLTSMTEEQKEELFYNYIHNDIYIDDFIDYFLAGELWHDITVSIDVFPELIDWFNKNHIDYRGLIEKGLAIDATGKNIY